MSVLSRVRMRVAITATAAIVAATLSLGPAFTAASNTESRSSKLELLEPIVRRHAGVLPPSVCEELIRLGEEKGFTVDVESIDIGEENHDPSQSIEVFERDDGITSPAIWAALEPWIPRLTALVKDSIDNSTDRIYFPDKPDRTPQLGWVFFRKYGPYGPSSDRKSLKLHVDSNMHTLNIALNGVDDYAGGGLFYVKPPARQEEEMPDGRPHVPNRYMTYRWLNKIKRENASDIVFPSLQGGDVLIHNFTVWHAVAPIETGIRYSFVLFYDMDNPAIQDDFDHGDDSSDDDGLKVDFYNGMSRPVDLAFVYETEAGEERVDVLEENMAPRETRFLTSYPGHVFRALVHATDDPVCEFEIRGNQSVYTIEPGIARSASATDPGDEL